MANSIAPYGRDELYSSHDLHTYGQIPGNGYDRGTFLYRSFDEDRKPAHSLHPTHGLDSHASVAGPASGTGLPPGVEENYPDYSAQTMNSVNGQSLGDLVANGRPNDLGFVENWHPAYSFQPTLSSAPVDEGAYGDNPLLGFEKKWNTDYPLQPMNNLNHRTQHNQMTHGSAVELGLAKNWDSYSDSAYRHQPTQAWYSQALGAEHAQGQGNPVELGFNRNEDGNPPYAQQPIHSFGGQIPGDGHADAPPNHLGLQGNATSHDTAQSDNISLRTELVCLRASLASVISQIDNLISNLPTTSITDPQLLFNSSRASLQAAQAQMISFPASEVARGRSPTVRSWAGQTPLHSVEFSGPIASSAHDFVEVFEANRDDITDQEGHSSGSQQEEPSVRGPVKNFRRWKVTYSELSGKTFRPKACQSKTRICLYITPPDSTYMKEQEQKYVRIYIYLDKQNADNLANSNRDEDLWIAMTKELWKRYQHHGQNALRVEVDKNRFFEWIFFNARPNSARLRD